MDAVNVATGNLFLHIPLVSFPQRGGKLHLDFKIYYSSPSYQQFYCTKIQRYCAWVRNSGSTVAVLQASWASLGIVPCGTNSCWAGTVGGRTILLTQWDGPIPVEASTVISEPSTEAAMLRLRQVMAQPSKAPAELSTTLQLTPAALAATLRRPIQTEIR